MPCSPGNPTQNVSLSGGQIRVQLGGTALCLSAQCDNPTTGCHPLTFVPCAPDIVEQQWAWHAATTGGGTLVSSAHPTECLDLASDGAGPAVGIYRCDGLIGQLWAPIKGSPTSGSNSLKTVAKPEEGARCVTMLTPPSPPSAGPITLDRNGAAQTFDGLGAISGGGATTRLLVDYPEVQQQQILDYLFKPNFGASLQILKVEIGGDLLTTDGSESSHMHDNETIDLRAGYEWWLMGEAKRRNPEIKFYGLPWAFPGWIGNDLQTGAQNITATPYDHPEQTVRYMLEWVRGAKSEYNFDIDYLGIWNESPSDATYVKMLRAALDAAGFHNTRIVAQDGGAQICNAMHNDAEYAAAVDVIGLHYPGDWGSWFDPCTTLGKPVWASEESSSYDDANGAACWARVVHSHYALRNITASIMWNLLGSYYPGTSWYASSMLTADQPWSGWYGVRGAGSTLQLPVVWATAHVTQFAKIGWRYLRNSMGSGELHGGGYYTTLVNSSNSDFALHVVKNSFDHAACTRPALPPSEETVEAETVTFVLAPSMGLGDHPTLACWRSNFELEEPVFFEQQPDIAVQNGRFTLRVNVGDYFTVTTVRTATRGSFATAVPPSQPRSPIPVVDDFEAVATSQQPRLWSQMLGAFEVHPDSSNASNKVLRQMGSQIPISNWRGRFSNMPGTIVGMREWQDVSISVRFRLPPVNSAACVATRVDWTFNVGVVLCVGGQGAWNLTYGNSVPDSTDPIVSGHLTHTLEPDIWHTVKLSTLSTIASAYLDGVVLFSNQTIRDIDTGFAALLTTGYYPTEFDDVSVLPIGDNWKSPPPLPPDCPAPGSSLIGHQLSARRCQPNGIIATDENWYLMPDWRLVHAESQLCAAAVSGIAGSPVALKPCNSSDPLQLWKNDYSNIHHGEVPLTLEAVNMSLFGKLDGTVQIQPPGWRAPNSWGSWTFFDSTGQLRSQRTPFNVEFPTKCLALCTDE